MAIFSVSNRPRVHTSVSMEIWLEDVRLLVNVVNGQTADQVSVLVDGSVVSSTHALVVVSAERVVGVTRRITGPRCGRLQRIIATS